MITLKEVYECLRVNLISQLMKKREGLLESEATRLADQWLKYNNHEILNEFDEVRMGFPWWSTVIADQILYPSDE